VLSGGLFSDRTYLFDLFIGQVWETEFFHGFT
jgi:hypothetical protein